MSKVKKAADDSCPRCRRAVGLDGLCFPCIEDDMRVRAFQMFYKRDSDEKDSLVRFVRAIVCSARSRPTHADMIAWHKLRKERSREPAGPAARRVPAADEPVATYPVGEEAKLSAST